MVGRLAGWLAKSAGPKVLIGVIVSSLIVISLLTWRWQAERDNAAEAQNRAEGLSTALAGAEHTITEQRADLAALDEAIKDQKAREQAARDRAAQAERRLNQLERSDEAVAKWSDASIPESVRGWLHDDTDSDGAR